MILNFINYLISNTFKLPLQYPFKIDYYEQGFYIKLKFILKSDKKLVFLKRWKKFRKNLKKVSKTSGNLVINLDMVVFSNVGFNLFKKLKGIIFYINVKKKEAKNINLAICYFLNLNEALR